MPRIPFTRGSFNVEYELCLLKNDSDAALEPIGEVLEHAQPQICGSDVALEPHPVWGYKNIKG